MELMEEFGPYQQECKYTGKEQFRMSYTKKQKDSIWAIQPWDNLLLKDKNADLNVSFPPLLIPTFLNNSIEI